MTSTNPRGAEIFGLPCLLSWNVEIKDPHSHYIYPLNLESAGGIIQGVSMRWGGVCDERW